MRVDLVVPDRRFSERAVERWEAFLRAVAPVTFPNLDSPPTVQVNPRNGLPPGAEANAQWYPPARIMPEYAEFGLSESFFEKPAIHQAAILLHEALHIRLYRDRLITNFRLIRRWPRFSQASTQYDLDRENLAWETLTFAQEVGVDKLLGRVGCPDAVREEYARARRRYYTNGEGYGYDDARAPSLAVYRLFYRLLRTELGILVTSADDVRLELEGLRDVRSTDLQQKAGDELPWFQEAQRQLLAITVESEDVDPNGYNELSDRILTVPAEVDHGADNTGSDLGEG